MKSNQPQDHADQAQLPEQLRCPVTGKPLQLEPDGCWIRVVGEPLRYPVRGGIPVLVPSAAEKLQA